MAYIYKIENDINNKIYIGKTTRSLEERFQEHCRAYKRDTLEKRPLYQAMKKYGIEHFHISLIEETNNPEEQEKYWIEYYGSFKNGYNATVGGDGKSYLDYDLIITTYKNCGNQEETAKLCNCSRDSVRRIIKMYNIPIQTLRGGGQNASTIASSHPVAIINDENQILHSFTSVADAGRWIQNTLNKITNDLHGITGNIRKCCQGERKIAYGYRWKFLSS